MQHNQNDNFYLQEAFTKLKLLNEDSFDLTVDRGVVDELKSFVADDIDAPFEEVIIDAEAENKDDLQDSYLGKVVIQCECCATKVYKEPTDVIIDKEVDLANIDEECPLCGKMLGWKVIGKIEPFDSEREFVDSNEDDEEVEITDDEITETLQSVLKNTEELTEDVDIHVDNSPEGVVVEVEKEVNDVVTVEDESVENVVDDVILVDENCNKDINEEVEIHIDQDAEGNAIVNIETDEFETVEVIEKEDNENIVSDIVDDIKLEEDLNNEFLDVDEVNIDVETSNEDDQKLEDPKEEPVIEETNEVELSESLTEDIENISLDTEDVHMEMTAEDNGRVVVITEPKENIEDVVDEVNVESIVPLTDEEITEIDNNEPVEEDDFTIDEFDENSFDELGESFLKKVYENVDSFKTTNVKHDANSLVVEGLIKFNSGKEKVSSFKFENFSKTKRNKVLCNGLNEMFSKSKRAFVLKGTLEEKKFVSESLTYNYTAKTINEDNNSEAVKVYGRSVIRK